MRCAPPGPLRLLVAAVVAGAVSLPRVAAAQASADLSVTVTVVRSCTVTEGAPDCGSTTGPSGPSGVSTAQPAPRTTTTSPSAAPGESGDAAAPQLPAHTVVTIQF